MASASRHVADTDLSDRFAPDAVPTGVDLVADAAFADRVTGTGIA
jgi:hypothetical protein